MDMTSCIESFELQFSIKWIDIQLSMPNDILIQEYKKNVFYRYAGLTIWITQHRNVLMVYKKAKSNECSYLLRF